MRAGLLVIGLSSGCQLAFPLDTPECASGLDLDEDGRCDDADPCIAPLSDSTADIDEDGVDGDPCPLIGNAPLLGDADMDDYDDRCDPHDSLVAPDRSICTMAFTDPGLSSQLWLARPMEDAWATQLGALEARPESGETLTAIAAVPIAGVTETTFEVLAEQSNLQDRGNFTLWLRANPTVPSAGDAGCQLVLDQANGKSSLFITPTGAAAPMAIEFLNEASIRLRGSIIEGATATTITCFVAYTPRSGGSGTTSLTITDAVTVDADGRFGLSATTWAIRVTGLQISDRGP